MAQNSEEIRKNGAKNAKKDCVQSGDNIYPEDGRFSIADSNATYRLLLEAFAQANLKNPREFKDKVDKGIKNVLNFIKK